VMGKNMVVQRELGDEVPTGKEDLTGERRADRTGYSGGL